MPTQIRKINELIDRAQHVIGRHELVEAKFVKKTLLHHEPIAHHRPNPLAATAQENHSEGPVASTFSTKSAHRGRYGGPRIHAALRGLGHTASRGRVERLMRDHGIRAIMPRRLRAYTTDSRHDWPIAPNRLDQKFAADRPNQIWLADISYVPTSEGWLYLAVVLDLFTRKIVGWAMRDHMRAELTIAALTMAIQRQKPSSGLIHHSDRGSQYAATDYRKVLDGDGMIQSMSRKGNCWDNAPMESCFGTIKTELVHQACYPTRDAARHDLFAYIEGYYNRQRLHSALGYITPEQAERQAA